MTPSSSAHLWLALILLAPLTARAADGTWTGGGIFGNWSDPANWSGGTIADGTDSTANFTSTGQYTINLDSNRTIGNLTFSGFGSGWTLGSGNGSVLTLDTSSGKPTIEIKSPTSATISASLAGSDGLTLVAINTDGGVSLNGTNTYTGDTIISNLIVQITSNASLGNPSGAIVLEGGRLVVDASLTMSRPVTVNDAGGWIYAAPGQTVNLTGVITGASPSAGFSFGYPNFGSTPGTTVVSGDNNYQGPTNLFGIVRLVDGIGLPTASNLVLSGTLETSGDFTRELGSGAGQFSLSDQGGFSAIGDGLSIWSGLNTNALKWGSTYFNPEVLYLNNSPSASSTVAILNDLDLNNDQRFIYVGDNPASSSDVAHIAGSIFGSSGTLSKWGPGKLVLSGTNSYGRTDINDGTLEVDAGSLGTGNVSFIGGSILTPTTPTLIFSQNDAYSVTNAMECPFADGKIVGTIIQNGFGTTTLAGTMTSYTGSITVNAGALLINTAVGGNANVQVQREGTLGGTGSLGIRKVDIFSGGTLAPGASIGTLSVGNVKFWSAVNSHFSTEIDLGQTLAADLLNVTGSVTLTNSPLDVALMNLPTSQTLPLTFLLVNNDASDPVIGQFGTIKSAAGFSVTVNYAFTGADALGRLGDGNDIAVTITPVPEPTALVLALTAAACLLTPRRRQPHDPRHPHLHVRRRQARILRTGGRSIRG